MFSRLRRGERFAAPAGRAERISKKGLSLTALSAIMILILSWEELSCIFSLLRKRHHLAEAAGP